VGGGAAAAAASDHGWQLFLVRSYVLCSPSELWSTLTPMHILPCPASLTSSSGGLFAALLNTAAPSEKLLSVVWGQEGEGEGVLQDGRCIPGGGGCFVHGGGCLQGSGG